MPDIKIDRIFNIENEFLDNQVQISRKQIQLQIGSYTDRPVREPKISY